ncbi:hypothetical protein [Paracoccus sp. S3-43]|uniref:arsenic resistance protein n=1 Tax=Paracoccus sp. S3-43 TaxID=3030011 RepID=UPI0023B0010F|nr:hypothetical protein [Paracoccus sp. S3-43]WEF24868.1 hypothetical protein PXD02_02625 [Paracoccus sp. S3-43]
MGWLDPAIGDRLSGAIDPVLTVLVSLLFFEIRPQALALGFGNLRFMALAWAANFLIVPLIGWAIASLFLSGQPLLFTGLVIYFMSPCTDWFLGFTRMARGDTALGAALIPVNLISQLLLYPVWLWLFTRHSGIVDAAAIPDTLLRWFLVPLLLAQGLRFGLERLLPAPLFHRVAHGSGQAVPPVIAALILLIFAANTRIIADHLAAFGTILIAVFLFFVATFLMGEAVARLARLPYPQQALLAMTTAARNAPLMLAVTAAAIPGQPLILAGIAIGMLVEFPHLAALTQILLRRSSRHRKARHGTTK